MKAKEIRDTEKGALDEKVLELKKELVKINAQVATGSAIKSPDQVKQIKKTLARIITITNEPKKAVVKEKKDVVKKEVGKGA